MKDYAFSKYIVALRHRQGLSRFDLARKLGIGYVTVAKWENAEAMPTVQELQRLSVFFNLSCEAIRAHSFVELPGCSVKVVEEKTAPEIAPAPIAEPAPIEEAPAPVAEPAMEKKPPVTIVYKPQEAPAPKAEPAPVAIAPAPKVEEPAPVTISPEPKVEEPAPEAAEPIASTTEMPKIDLNVIRNPEAEAFYQKKKIEEKNEEIVSSHKRFGVKIRRPLALLVDTVFSILIAIILAVGATFITAFLMLPEDIIATAVGVFAGVGYGFAFMLRDAIAGGTSLGKRIFGLCVVDKVNAAKPVVWQRVVRTLGLALASTPDAIVALICGRSIGDFIAGTAVVSRKDYNRRLAEKNPLDPPVKVRKNRTGVTAFLTLVAMALVVALVAGFSYVMTIMLENEKQTEEYLYAYEALIESDEFAATGADSSEIIFTAFDRYTTLEDGGSVTIVEYTFETEEYYIYVTVESSVDGISVTEIIVESVYIFE